MAAFKEGDLVKLKSGGPDMTIMSLGHTGSYLCVWFSDSKRNEGYFGEESIVKVEESDE